MILWFVFLFWLSSFFEGGLPWEIWIVFWISLWAKATITGLKIGKYVWYKDK